MAREKELPGVEVDKDQRFLTQGLRGWTLRILAVGVPILAVLIIAGWIWPSGGTKSSTQAAQRSLTTLECPGKVGRKILTGRLDDVSNSGACRPIFRIENFQNVLFKDGKDEFEASVWPDRVVREAKAKAGIEQVYASLCPLWLKGPLEFDCTRKVQTAQTR